MACSLVMPSDSSPPTISPSQRSPQRSMPTVRTCILAIASAQASFTSLAKYGDDTLRLLAAALTTPALSDAEIFLSLWGSQAGALGWTARELFGLHPIPERSASNFRRLARYDSTGLIWLLRGRPVIALRAR